MSTRSWFSALSVAGIVLVSLHAPAVAQTTFRCCTYLPCGKIADGGDGNRLHNDGQLQLAWNDCQADDGQLVTNWACDGASADPIVLAGSFTLTKTMEYFVATDIAFFFEFPDVEEVPEWWHMGDPPACRSGSFALSLDSQALPRSGASCPDPWSGGSAATGLISEYTVGVTSRFAPPRPDVVRVRLAIARGAQDGVTLVAGQNYMAFRLLIDRRRTVGSGACAGCDAAIQVHFCRLVVYNNPPAPEGVEAREFGNSESWELRFGPTAYGQYESDPTSVKNRTWGAIKSLYR